MTWKTYRAENPMLDEMRSYNKLVRSRINEEFTDRYKALGIPYPDPKTMCRGDCEGIGLVPIKGQGWATEHGKHEVIDDPHPDDAEYQKRWEEAEAKAPTDDGWHFVKCVACGGTGKREESLQTCIKDLRSLLD